MEFQETNKKNTVAIVLILVLAVLLATGSFRYFSVLRQESQRQAAADERVKATDGAFKASHLHNSPTALRDLFLDDVRNGVNDKVTKSAIYFITHRFFDNGGNIYEIYDFIENNPELAFMKEAEAIYPGIFDQIKKKQVPPTQVDRASYAYLAYIETLYRHGYADIAAKATAANLYAKTAYYNTEIAKEMPKEQGKQRAKNAKRDIAKAIGIMEVSKNDVAMILDGKLTEEDITPRDILVGLNQYAAALRYLEAYGADFTSPKKAKEIFTYTMEYSRRNVPELMFFTSLLNASTLALLEVAQPVDIRTALYPILEVDAKGPLLESSIIHKILNSRHERPPENIGDTLMSIYSKRNTLRLADKVPEFRVWLMSNGWTEEDFR